MREVLLLIAAIVLIIWLLRRYGVERLVTWLTQDTARKEDKDQPRHNPLDSVLVTERAPQPPILPAFDSGGMRNLLLAILVGLMTIQVIFSIVNETRYQRAKAAAEEVIKEAEKAVLELERAKRVAERNERYGF